MILAWLACGSEPAPLAGACYEPTVPTWETFGAGYVRTWCAPCHSEALVGENRYDAPPDVNFDTYPDVVARRERIRILATGPSPTMPPAGGPDPEEVERLLQWLECGLPGGDIAPEPLCDGPVLPGDLVVRGDGLCPGPSGVTGDLTVEEDAALDCVCEVGGELVVAGAATRVQLPNLHTVGGARIEGNPSLVAVDLPALETVGAGGVVVRDNPGLAGLDLGELGDVGGVFEVSGNAALIEVVAPELRAVAGDLRIVTNAALTGFQCGWLGTVGGSLEVADNPSLAAVCGGFDALETVGGEIGISGNAALLGLYLFPHLGSVGGDIVLEDNDALGSLVGFGELPSLPGALRITGHDSLVELDVFPVAASVAGSLEIADNPALVVLAGFDALGSVGGDLRITGNPQLPEAQATDLVGRVNEIGGTVDTSGNLPTP